MRARAAAAAARPRCPPCCARCPLRSQRSERRAPHSWPLRSSRAGNELQIDKMVGKSMVVSGNMPMAQQGGFYCNVCECVVKDSISWLDHINGKKHNRALGMNMRCACPPCRPPRAAHPPWALAPRGTHPGRASSVGAAVPVVAPGARQRRPGSHGHACAASLSVCWW